MKRSFPIIASIAALLLAGSTLTTFAKDKAVTLKGEAKCAKCMLHEGDTCQTVIQVEKKGRTQTYYVVANDVSKAFHEDVCHAAKTVTAKGTVAEVDGKQQLALTKIKATN